MTYQDIQIVTCVLIGCTAAIALTLIFIPERGTFGEGRLNRKNRNDGTNN